MKQLISAIGAAMALACSASAQAQWNVRDIGTLGGDTLAYDINNFGQVVGSSGLGAFLFDTSTGALTELGQRHENYFGYGNTAYAINDAGDIAYTIRYPLFPHFGEPRDTLYLRSADGAETRLVRLDWYTSVFLTEDSRAFGHGYWDGPRANFATEAGGANGRISTDVTWRPYVDLTAGMISTINPLASLIDVGALNSAVPLLGGGLFTSVVDINNSGQILARASDGRSYVVTPVPEPATWAILSLGLVGAGFARRRRLKA